MFFYKKKEKKMCIMCGEDKITGIIINSGFICDDCEYEIVHTEVEDEKYPFFVRRLKKIWPKNA